MQIVRLINSIVIVAYIVCCLKYVFGILLHGMILMILIDAVSMAFIIMWDMGYYDRH